MAEKNARNVMGWKRTALATRMVAVIAINVVCLGCALRNTPTNMQGDRVWVDALAWSPAGDAIAAGGPDTAVRILDSSTGKLIRKLEEQQGSIASIEWSNDGAYLAIASHEPGVAVRIWDAESWDLLSSFEVTRDLVNTVALSPDRQYAAVTSMDPWNCRTPCGTVEIRETATGQLMSTIEFRAGVGDVAWSPDGWRIAAGLSNVVIWDVSSLATPVELRVLGSAADQVYQLTWSPDGEHIATGSWKGAVALWDLASGHKTWTVMAHADIGVKDIEWSPDGTRIATCAWDETVKIWDVGDMRKIATFTHGDYVNVLDWSPDSKRLAAGDHDGRVRIWDAPAVPTDQ